MLFSSIVFLFIFLPAVLLLYYIFSFSRQCQNIILLLSSLLFYAWGEPVYVFLMLASIAVNSIVALLLEKSDKNKTRKLLVVSSIVFNIGLLFVFKYLGFVLSTVGINSINLPLPIGISFFTFQAMSYVIDVYRRTVKAENPFYVGLYISFFPQLIAGPIIQYNSISEQIRNRKTTWDMFTIGISRFVVGLGKKILLSNCFAGIADNVFQWSAIGTERMAVPVMLAWLGSIAYSLQIYYDFSAYSDMAIGLGLCFGFKFPENFNYPYIATSISDFWKRWHISLTNWFREYVYFPLGGSRVSNQDYMVRNMLIVWLLTGIWHGANWTFIFWGMMYFVFQLAERFFNYSKHVKNVFVQHIYTLVVVNALWVVFRADNLYQAGRFFMNMLGVNNNGFYSDLAVILLRENFVFLILGIIFAMPFARNMNAILFRKQNTFLFKVCNVFYPIGMILMFVLCVAALASGTYNPFIYFNF